MAKGGKPRCGKDLDEFELCARDRLAYVLGQIEQMDCGGGPVGIPDFKVELPGGGLAVVEVTAETEEAQQALDAASARFFDSFSLGGSSWRWLVSPAAGAELNRLSRSDLRSLLADMESNDRRSVDSRGDWRDPFVRCARALRIVRGSTAGRPRRAAAR